jgi:Tol biopolymer transport system component/DNA-binding winged helix-turn-helix (wHTH) protein
MPDVARQKVRFGPFELDLESAELFKYGQKLKLQGQPIQVLSILLEKPGELVTRDDLRQRLWPADNATFVDFEHGLNTNIRKLRQALGDEAETPRYIETLPRRGYRFVGHVTAQPALPLLPSTPLVESSSGVASGDAQSPAADIVARQFAQPVPGSRKKRLVTGATWAAVLTVLTLGIIAMFRVSWLGSGPLRIVGTKRLTFSGNIGLHASRTVEAYDSLQSDGRRIYYTVASEQALRSVSVNGGDEKVLPTPMEFPVLLHISPDGSTLLIKSTTGTTGSTESAIWLVPAEGGAARKLGEVQAQDAAWAPDGKTIVFAQGQDLYLSDNQGNTSVKLASTAGRAFWLRWSPDGSKLRFSVVDPKKLTYALWELRQGGELRLLLPDWKGAGVCCGIWTTDGEHFLFRTIRDNQEELWIRPERGFAAAEATLLTAGGMEIGAAVASSLEKKIFIAGGVPSSGVLVLNLSTGQTSPLNLGLPADRVTYSRDGQRIALVEHLLHWPQGGGLWRVRVDSRERRALTVFPMEVFMAQYSPDGKRIAFMARWPDQPWKIYWVSDEGGALHDIPSGVVNQADPNWSPDSQSILFGQPPNYMSESGTPRAIYVYDVRTGTTSNVPGSTGLFSPRWSLDGRYVVAISLDQQGLALLEVTTGKWRSLVAHPPVAHADVGHPFWSPDSEWVYFNSGGLWRIRVSNGRLEQVPVRSDCSSWFANGFAPDGSVLVSCLELRQDIYALEWK